VYYNYGIIIPREPVKSSWRRDDRGEVYDKEVDECISFQLQTPYTIA